MMDADELVEWMAYELSNDKEIKERLNKEIKDEGLTPTEIEARDIKAMLMGLGQCL